MERFKPEGARIKWTPDSLLTGKQVAAELGYSERTIKRWRARGKGPPHHAINHAHNRPTYLYRYRELMAWLEEQRRQG